MEKVFNNPSELEKIAKTQLNIPPFLMMENAANCMAQFIVSQKIKSLIILCGKGNNGGDGFALARLLLNFIPREDITLLVPALPVAEEAKVQFEICQKMKISIKLNDQVFDFLDNLKNSAQPGGYKQSDGNKQLGEFEHKAPFKNKDFQTAVVDCLFGIGFHGELAPKFTEILDCVNAFPTLKIACDIPSALYFKADYTITMGAYKTVLLSDKAKNVCGKIILADLGIPRQLFTSFLEEDAFLLEPADSTPPYRTNKTSHKGTYGHTVVFSGHKAGASVIAATASVHFGSGLTTLLQTEYSNLEQFKISPQLMISSEIPRKTTALVFGPGFDSEIITQNVFSSIYKWFSEAKNPAIVLDAGVFGCTNFFDFLKILCSVENARIVLTPHLLEYNRLLCGLKQFLKNEDFPFLEEEFSVQTLSENPMKKIETAKFFMTMFPNVAIIIKSANTFIASENKIFVCTEGAQSLAKGGSGDVLAGMVGALLSQGYNAKDAAVTAVLEHAAVSQKAGAQSYNLTPEKIISLL